MEDPDTGAMARGDGVSESPGTYLGVSGEEPSRQPKGAGGFDPARPGPADGAPANAKKGRKRRKRRRGRKVFAPGISSQNPQGAAVVEAVAAPPESPAPIRIPPPPLEPSGRPWERGGPLYGRDGPIFAALDLGTNNCRLLVATPGRPGQFRVVDAYSRIVRLGEGLSATGRLSQAAMDRTVEALKVCADKLRNRSIRRARLVATEACRAAENGVEFLDRVRREARIDLEIIDRQTEARLAVSGCGPLVERDTDAVVLFDIGGGSSEIALIDLSRHRTPRLSNHIVSWTSLPVGVVSLAERYGGRDVTPETFAAMVADVAEMIGAFDGRHRISHLMKGSRFHLLGTSGTVTTLAGVHLGLERYDRRRVDGLWLDNEHVDSMIAKLRGWDFQQRVANPCIGADRADLVLAGCAILEAIRAHWPSPRLRVADRGLREGILSELMAEEGVWRRPQNGGGRP
ncbi:Ppx/GppA phosphatase family protein [Mesorhizobium sp. CN2-181]|uniref:Ppx/GppA phosphatase family protein n=1 Tax=Mesorhizobium yinganensis TaxID=3157707 RepID=UPI0032B82EFC